MGILFAPQLLIFHMSGCQNVGPYSVILPGRYPDGRDPLKNWNQSLGLIDAEHTGCSLNIVFFSSNVVIFLDSASSAAALVFYLPGVCTPTDTEGKQRKTRVRNILKSLENTILNEHPVCERKAKCNCLL